MLQYANVNVNPHHRKTGDCSTRALCSLLGCSWEAAMKLECDEAIASGYDPSSHEVMEAILKKAGWVKERQPRKLSGSKYKVREMDSVCSLEDLKLGVIVNVANHYVYLTRSEHWDEWNSGFKTVGNWYRCDSPTHCYDNLPRREKARVQL